jgi:hypothetical protein
MSELLGKSFIFRELSIQVDVEANMAISFKNGVSIMLSGYANCKSVLKTNLHSE